MTGLNGMGKTNSLDAIYFLCLCKSNRSVNDRDLILRSEEFYRVEGSFETGEKSEKIVAKYPKGGKKTFERGDVAFARLADYVGMFPVVMIAPDDTELIREGSEERRRFMDSTLSQMHQGYLNALMTYNQVLRQRNSLLRQASETGRLDLTVLQALDQQIYAPAALVFEARQEFIKKITPLFNAFYAQISSSREKVQMAYASPLKEQQMEAILTENLGKDMELGRTSQGLHRDDIVFKMDGKAVKKFASQGQLKSYFLALRLAQYEIFRTEVGKMPILLLDDVFDKLDATRVSALLQLLSAKKFGQVFITDTQKDRVVPLVEALGQEFKVFEIADGKSQ